ncbi:MAG: riboflavin synthase [Salaquimonas sp.]
MFTGIVSDIGVLESVEQLDQGKRFRVRSSYDTSGIDIGASIAHSGVCLTVTKLGDNWHEVEVWEEALRLSTLGTWHMGQKINLERSLKMGDELGGHLVSGHVDGLADVIDVKKEGDATRFTLQAPKHLAKFIAQKGSVALDGTSLTVNGVDNECFDVLLIAHTLEVTTWGDVQKGDKLNIEIDQMARYAARLLEAKA